MENRNIIYFFTTYFTIALHTSKGCWYKNIKMISLGLSTIIPCKNPYKNATPPIMVGEFVYIYTKIKNVVIERILNVRFDANEATSVITEF